MRCWGKVKEHSFGELKVGSVSQSWKQECTAAVSLLATAAETWNVYVWLPKEYVQGCTWQHVFITTWDSDSLLPTWLDLESLRDIPCDITCSLRKETHPGCGQHQPLLGVQAELKRKKWDSQLSTSIHLSATWSAPVGACSVLPPCLPCCGGLYP